MRDAGTYSLISRRSTYHLVMAVAVMAILALSSVNTVDLLHRSSLSLIALAPLFVAIPVVVLSLGSAIRTPPVLDIRRDGLSIRRGGQTRFWAWGQIDHFYIQSLRKVRHVNFAWQPEMGAQLKGESLGFVNAEPADQLFARLNASLADARQRGAAIPRLPEPTPQDVVTSKRLRLLSILLTWMLFGAGACALFDLLLSQTSLLTHVPAQLVEAFVVLGIGLGLAATYVNWRRDQLPQPSPITSDLRNLRAWVLGVFLVTLGGGVGNYGAWRVWNIEQFAEGAAPVQQRYYRILDFDRYYPRRGPEVFDVTISPYTPSPTYLPISEDDYDRLTAAARPYKWSSYCYPVLTQASAHAVRMLRPRAAAPHEQRIVECPSHTDDHFVIRAADLD